MSEEEQSSKTSAGREKLPVLKLNPFNVKPRFTYKCSVSQVDTWRLCQRKWGFGIIDRKRYQNRYAVRGTAVHTHCENWLEAGIEPPEDDRYGKLVRTAIIPGKNKPSLLPLPGTCEIERDFEYVSSGGIIYIGAIDVQLFNLELGLPYIIDHKSTTNKKWALVSDEEYVKAADFAKMAGDEPPKRLSTNTQSSLYGEVVATRWNSNAAALRWIYYIDDLKRPKSFPVDQTVGREQLLSVVAEMDKTATEIAEKGRIVKKAKDLPANPLACEAYGGCPYQEICGLSDSEKLGAVMTQMSIRDKLMAKMGSAKPAAAPVVQQAVTPAAVAQQAAVQGSLLDRMRQGTPAPAQGLAVVQKPVQAPAPAQAAPAGNSIMAKMRANTAAAGAAPAQTPAPAPAAANVPTAEQIAAAAALVAAKAPLVAAPGSLLAKMREKAQEAAEGPAPVAVSHNAYDINPPESPETPIDDPDELAAANGAAKIAQTGETAEEKKKRGRAPSAPKAAITTSGVTDAGYIFSKVFSEAIAHGAQIETAGAWATQAVLVFRAIPSE